MKPPTPIPSTADDIIAAMSIGFTPIASSSVNNARHDIVRIADTTEISIVIKNGVATLSGHVSNAREARLAERQMMQMSGINQIINLISVI